ncbi:MAG: hypothetical protein ABW252_08865 [Polyangiales bacterium]
MDIRTAALVVGIALAAFNIVSACVVYLRTQTFGAAGVSLVGGGVVLIALSVWSATALKVSEESAARIGDVQRDVLLLSEASQAVSAQLLSVAQAQALSLQRADALAAVLERRVPASTEPVHKLDRDLASVPPVDLGKLERLSRGGELASRRALEAARAARKSE